MSEVPAVETEPSGAAPEPSATSAPLDSWTDGPDEPVYRVARQQLLWWDARCRRGKEVWGFFVTTSGEHFEEVNGRGKGPSDHQVACWVCDFMSDPGQQEKGQLHPLLHRQETSATLSVDAGEVPPDLEAAAAAALLSWKEKPPSGRGLTGGHNHVTRYCSKSGMGCLTFHVAKWHPVELAQLKELLRVEPLPTLPSVRRGPKRKADTAVAAATLGAAELEGAEALEGMAGTTQRPGRRRKSNPRGGNDSPPMTSMPSGDSAAVEIQRLRAELRQAKSDLSAARQELQKQRMVHHRAMARAGSHAEHVSAQAQLILGIAQSIQGLAEASEAN
mmetsp:Transcript_43552/g.110273  ORF Transcript_43552/g.110273 Transcript_43552/m.110273 type:complete len:332 (-) Transcript_43552:274-1269(-)